jgi:hypothetical protein
MGAKSQKIKYMPWAVIVCLAIGWSTFESLLVVWAASRHPKISKNIIDVARLGNTDFKREEQKYFLQYGIYIPLEDMMFVEELSQRGERYTAALNRSCSGLTVGYGFAIWLPLKTRWPLLGERISEWCWKPPIQK